MRTHTSNPPAFPTGGGLGEDSIFAVVLNVVAAPLEGGGLTLPHDTGRTLGQAALAHAQITQAVPWRTAQPNDDHEDEDNRNAPPTHIYIPDGVTAMREVRGAPRRPLLQLAADRARILPRNRAFHNPALAVQGKKRQTGNTLFAGRD